MVMFDSELVNDFLLERSKLVSTSNKEWMGYQVMLLESGFPQGFVIEGNIEKGFLVVALGTVSEKEFMELEEEALKFAKAMC